MTYNLTNWAGGYLDLDTGVFTAETTVSRQNEKSLFLRNEKGVHFQGTYNVSWSYQGPPDCAWLYRGGERVAEAYVANIMVPFFPHLRFCQDDAIQ